VLSPIKSFLCDLVLWSEKTEDIPVARWLDVIAPLPRFIRTELGASGED
jgi:hypothetical protein